MARNWFLSAFGRKRKDESAAFNVPPANSRERTPHYRALEQRIAFDAAGATTAAAVAEHQAAQDDTAHTAATDAAVAQLQQLATAMAAPPTDVMPDVAEFKPTIEPTTAATSAAVTHEIVFIDSKVQDRETLLAGINPNAEVIVLDATRDGVDQIADALRGRSDVDAIHIISHGSDGQVQLGNAVLEFAVYAGQARR